jgi:hypothetical protein
MRRRIPLLAAAIDENRNDRTARRIAANIAKLPGFFLSEHLELFLWLLLPGGITQPKRMRGNTLTSSSLPPVGTAWMSDWTVESCTFHNSRRIKPRHGHIVLKEGKTYYRWCFSDLAIAQDFIEQFGGEFC